MADEVRDVKYPNFKSTFTDHSRSPPAPATEPFPARSEPTSQRA
jgi:hypothetical protein